MILATGALVTGGLLAGSGQAQAATLVHCGTLFQGASFSGCAPFTDTGGPYTVDVDTFIVWNPVVNKTTYAYNVRTTCQSLAPFGSAPGSHLGSGCTVPVPQ